MDKIRLVVPLLEGPAKCWYERIHPHINRHAAQREGIPFIKDSPYRKWSSFFDLIQTSFGQSLSRDLYVVEWEKIRHQDGKIDEFLDKLGDLMWKVGYLGEAYKDKIKFGLTSSLRRSWAAVQNKPDNVSAYMGALRDFAHQIEDDDHYEKRHSSNRTSHQAESSGGKKKKEKKKNEGKEHAARSSTQKDNKSGKKNSTGFKDKDKELKGFPDSIRDERRKSSVCLKCGKGGHSWYNCYTKEPVTRSVSAVSRNSKRKREDEKATKEPSSKKPKVERVQASPRKRREVAPVAKEVAEAEAQPPVSPPRIFEIEDEATDHEMF